MIRWYNYPQVSYCAFYSRICALWGLSQPISVDQPLYYWHTVWYTMMLKIVHKVSLRTLPNVFSDRTKSCSGSINCSITMLSVTMWTGLDLCSLIAASSLLSNVSFILSNTILLRTLPAVVIAHIQFTFVASYRQFHHGCHDSLLVSEQMTQLVHFTLQYYTRNHTNTAHS